MDIHASQTRRASNWEDLGIKSPAATILTTYDSSSVTSFSSASADLLIKPFNVEQLQLAVEVARSKILRARSELETYERSNNPDHSVGKRQFLQRVAAIVRKPYSHSLEKCNLSSSANYEKLPDPAEPELLPPRASQCDRQS